MRAALTQKEMAQLLGCRSSATICQYEARKREPDLRTALAYQVIFGIAVDELFPGIYQEVEKNVQLRAEGLAEQVRSDDNNPALAHKRQAISAILATASIGFNKDKPQTNV